MQKKNLLIFIFILWIVILNSNHVTAIANNIKKVGSLEVQIWIEGPLGWGGSCVKVIPKKDVNSPSFLVNLWARELQKGEYTNIDPE